ncbi:rcc01693 family protein [Methyloceanibacter marginalis]|nr:rcc01693 family protein [Methyloceanibacter marginalis]
MGPPFGDEGGVGQRDPFSWGDAMKAGLGALRLAPHVFWAMTPREFDAALKGAFGDVASPLSRRDLAALMGAYPDTDGVMPAKAGIQ